MSTPPATGSRLPWSALPASIQHAVAVEVGEIRQAHDRTGGFSPGAAAVLDLVDGTRVFVKATSSTLNPDSLKIYQAEARVAAMLPPEVPAPRLRAVIDRDSWLALAFDFVPGHSPELPWNSQQLQQVLDQLGRLPALLTPSPIDVPTVEERFRTTFTGWRRLAADPTGLAQLSPWASRNVDRLAALEADWPSALAGDTLLHSDLRADNLLLDGDRTWLVDWPWACRGVAWFDLLGMLPSVVMQGGPPLSSIVASHPVFADADPNAVTVGLAVLVGYFLDAGRRPAPPGLPTLRAFQTAQGRAGLPALVDRIGLR